MDESSKQAALSAVRSVLIAIGSIVAAKGIISEEAITGLIGAVVTILSTLWGIWDKYNAEKKTKEREAVAVNVGIAVADRTEGKTPAVSVEAAPDVIEAFAPVAKEDAKIASIKATPESPLVASILKGKP